MKKDLSAYIYCASMVVIVVADDNTIIERETFVKHIFWGELVLFFYCYFMNNINV